MPATALAKGVSGANSGFLLLEKKIRVKIDRGGGFCWWTVLIHFVVEAMNFWPWGVVATLSTRPLIRSKLRTA